MIDVAGEHLQYLAFHHMFAPRGRDSVLHDNEYRKDPAEHVGSTDGTLPRS